MDCRLKTSHNGDMGIRDLQISMLKPWIEKVKRERGWTNQQWADAAKLNVSTLVRATNPKVRTLTATSSILRLAEAANVPPPATSLRGQSHEVGERGQTLGFHHIPLHTTPAGATAPDAVLVFLNSQGDETTPQHPNQAKAPPTTRTFAVRLPSDHMYPVFQPGDLAYVIENQMPRRDDDCLVTYCLNRDQDDEIETPVGVVLRYVGTEGETVHCRQFTPDRTLSFSKTDVRLHAVVGKG